MSFNPHTHAGCDLCNVNFQVYAVQFQSTHPRRVWHLPVMLLALLHSFNPHTHAGCDLRKHLFQKLGTYVSIHTPTQGVTASNNTGKAAITKFQSTHPRRVWLTSAGAWSYQSMFQSTHPRRVWHPSRERPLDSLSFNPHTHAGCDSISNNIL